MNTKHITLLSTLVILISFGCSSSNTEGTSQSQPTGTSADAALRQLQSLGTLPTLDVSSSLLGTDSDGNGVRDDVDKYIAGLPDTAIQKKALTQVAQALQSTLTVDRTDPNALSAISKSLMRSDGCI